MHVEKQQILNMERKGWSAEDNIAKDLKQIWSRDISVV
jgi:hypothetical protein